MSNPPFGSRYPIDMMIGVCGRLVIIQALADHVERCCELPLEGRNAEEAAVLIIEANAKVSALLLEINRAVDFLREVEDGRAAA